MWVGCAQFLHYYTGLLHENHLPNNTMWYLRRECKLIEILAS